MRQEPVTNSLDDCLEYLRSDRVAGMMLVWRSYAYLALDFTKYYERLVTIEQEGACCGFGPPTRCTVRQGVKEVRLRQPLLRLEGKTGVG